MILRKKNPLHILAIGSVCMVLGILLSILMRPFEAGHEVTFLRGFLTALSGCLLGLSIVLNTVGIFRLSREKARSAENKS